MTKQTSKTTTQLQAEWLLDYLGGDWDITVCSECGKYIVVEFCTGEPQTCQQLACVYSALKDELKWKDKSSEEWFG